MSRGAVSCPGAPGSSRPVWGSLDLSDSPAMLLSSAPCLAPCSHQHPSARGALLWPGMELGSPARAHRLTSSSPPSCAPHSSPPKDPSSHPHQVWEVLGVPWPGRALCSGVQPTAGGDTWPETLPWVAAGTGGPTGHCPSQGSELARLPGLPVTPPSRSRGPQARAGGRCHSCSGCAKVAGLGDLSPSCRVPGGMKGHRVPRASPAPAGPRRAGGGGRDVAAALAPGSRLFPRLCRVLVPAGWVRVVGLGGTGVSHRGQTSAQS